MKELRRNPIFLALVILGCALVLPGCKFLEDEFVGLQKAPLPLERLVEEWASH